MSECGFSPDHLQLFRQFYTDKKCTLKQYSLENNPRTPDMVPLTWKAHAAIWRGKLAKMRSHIADRKPGILQWIFEWQAVCTDASQPRCLIAKPGETIQCNIKYINHEVQTTCIIQMQAAADFYRVSNIFNRIDISQICHNTDKSRRGAVMCEGCRAMSVRCGERRQWGSTCSRLCS